MEFEKIHILLKSLVSSNTRSGDLTIPRDVKTCVVLQSTQATVGQTSVQSLTQVWPPSCPISSNLCQRRPLMLNLVNANDKSVPASAALSNVTIFKTALSMIFMKRNFSACHYQHTGLWRTHPQRQLVLENQTQPLPNLLKVNLLDF